MGERKLYIIIVFLLLLAYSNEVKGQSNPYRIEKLSLSSNGFNELAPTIYKDGILFLSDRRISSITKNTTYKDEKLYNIYIAVKKDTSEFERPVKLSDQSSQLVQYAAACIAPDNKTVYFTRSVLSGRAAKKRNVVNPFGIFIGDMSGTSITNVRPFKYNSTEYNVAQPSVSRDGKYLFFVSNMPGGMGESDIYFCENINGEWGKPVNLGPKVNSASIENYPFMHPSGRLYFSSDRPSSAPYLGQMDVYYTSLIYGVWDTPVALPEPVNSPEDDYAFVAEENFQTGYFTRNSRLTTDIWKFRSTIIRKLTCDSLQLDSYCYQFTEENALRFDTIPFTYIWNFGDGSREEGYDLIHCYEKPGKYIVTVDITNLITKETQKAVKTIPMDVAPIEQPFINSVDNSQAGQLITLDAMKTYLPGWTIAQYYWNFGDDTFAVGEKVEHRYLKDGIYNVQLIVTSSPDSTGVVREACVSKNIIIGRTP